MVGWAEPGNEGSIEMELVNGSKNPPFNFADSFESYDDFVINPSPWITWSQYDVQNYGMTGVTFPNSNVPYVMLIMNPNETDPPIVDDNPAQDGDKYAIVSVKTGSPTLDNKWVITPELSFNETSQLNFWGRSITDAYGLERIRVMVSTSGSDPEDFTKISEGDYMEVPVDWTEYTYSLSAFAGETGHVAINYVSNDSFIFMLDNFKVTAEEDTPEDLIYTATLNLEAGEYQYKYFRNETWAHGEWDGDPNRVVVVEGDMEVNDIFGDPGLSDKALITEFSFDEGQDDVTIDGFEILVHVAVGTDITSLTPSITISEGATINYEYPTAMNFTNPVEFVVTAEDGVTTNTYKVTVKPTGVEENLLANLSVYPNPFGNQISVRNAEGVNRVIITNLIGQVVMDTPLTSETINTSKLSNGVYMVIFQGLKAKTPQKNLKTGKKIITI